MTVRRYQNIMCSVSPRDVEKFYFYILLLHVPGRRCYEELRLVKEVMPTFKDAYI